MTSGRRHRSPAAWALAATLVLGVGIGWQLMLGPPPEVIPDAEVTAPELEAMDAAPSEEMVPQAAAPTFKRRELPTDRPRAPAPASPMQESIKDMAGAARLQKSAPKQALPDCRAIWLPDEALLEDWLEAMQRARAAGDLEAEACLRTRCRQLHGDQCANAE